MFATEQDSAYTMKQPSLKAKKTEKNSVYQRKKFGSIDIRASK